MKDVIYKKKINQQTNTKVMCICQKKEEKDCNTLVRKGFYYNVSKTAQVKPILEAPEITIKKVIDTIAKIEKFYFQVRGSFFITHGRILRKVNFHHSLNIKVSWKKDFSPKKSAVLTE